MKMEKITTAAPAVKAPDPVDLHVGGRVRTRRKFMGLSQEQLADAIDLTFQQVQKYERGSNRISASKLYQIAQVLKAPVAYFFEGYANDNTLDHMETSEAETAVHGFLMTTDGIELVSAFPRIKAAKTKRRILDLVNALAEDE